MRYTLKPHPDFAHPAIDISVEAERSGRDMMHLLFSVEGDTDDVIWPELDDQRFSDGLWKHSCCEAFVGLPDSSGYIELNVATSMLWAAYAFDDYRAGMTPLPALDPISAGGSRPGSVWVSFAVRLPQLARAVAWRVGLTVVIEAVDGTKSYWALAHAPGAPDFHNPDCFIATLPAPTAP